MLYRALVSDLDALNGGKRNNAHDALIAEAAIVNGYTLVTADYHLQLVAQAQQCHVVYFNSRA